MGSFIYPLENRDQEPFNPLPDAGIVRLTIPGDVQALDLGVLMQPLRHVLCERNLARSDQHHRLLISRILTVIIRTMNARQRKSPVTDLLRSTIVESGIPYNQLERATGVHRASIMRFLRGHSMRLDLAERLMVYFGLEVRKRK